jgi:hypothetical protein
MNLFPVRHPPFWIPGVERRGTLSDACSYVESGIGTCIEITFETLFITFVNGEIKIQVFCPLGVADAAYAGFRENSFSGKWVDT